MMWCCLSLYGSHPVVIITKQTTHLQTNTIQVYFNCNGCTYMYATRFGLYLGHPQASQYKKHKKGRYNKSKIKRIFAVSDVSLRRHEFNPGAVRVKYRVFQDLWTLLQEVIS